MTQSAVGGEAQVVHRGAPHALRFASILMAAASTGAAVLTGVAFAEWARIDNAISWPAMEHSTVPHYPAGHAVFGWALGLGLFAFTGFAAVAATVAIVGARALWTPGRVWWLVLLAGSFGAVPPTVIRTSIPIAALMAIPAIVAFGRLFRTWAPAK